MIDDKETARIVQTIIAMDFKPILKSVGSIRIGESMRYYGQLDGEIPSGFGCILSLSEMFMGEFWNGLLHGLGKIRFSNGDTCTGGFEEGMCKKFGKYVTAESTIYKASDTVIN